MSDTQSRQRGFTIVELLIVIVVIGILAAITIVAYNGIQQRARNIQTVSAAKDAMKLIVAYKAINGIYPSGAYSYACIGEYASDVCQYYNAGAEVGEQTAFKNEIATVGTMPQPDTKLFDIGTSRTSAGAFYRNAQKNLTYTLAGSNQSCSAGGNADTSVSGVTTCTYTFE